MLSVVQYLAMEAQYSSKQFKTLTTKWFEWNSFESKSTIYM